MSWLRRDSFKRGARLVSTSLVALGVAGALTPACLSRPIEPIEPRRTSTLVEQFTRSKVDKIDILLAIDDSGSMADKQAILAVAVPDLIEELVNPACVDDTGGFVEQPAGPLQECPPKSRREFEPVLDIHIGVISTSLGPRGSNMSPEACPNDSAKLLERSMDADGNTYPTQTWNDLGFLAWDPTSKLDPAGETDSDVLGDKLEDMVRGVGQEGCGYEAQLESWYRFLIDPEPYDRVEVVDGRATLVDVDGELLAQRQSFLRPDSLVAIVMLSDENDCSFTAHGYGYFTANEKAFAGMQARSECAIDPDDPCCAVCGKAPKDCPADPKCGQPVPADHAMSNLHCFNQKQRFGHDFLYPVDRYVTGLTALQVPNREGELVDNPLFVGQKDGRTWIRPQENVFLTGIVGVPWQHLAREQDGKPTLAAGLKTASELAEQGVWHVILGDPNSGVAPTDPHMVETFELRGDLPSPDSLPDADEIHGHEFNALLNPSGDRQYACIFDLPEPNWVDCTTVGTTACDCKGDDVAEEKKPVCQDDQGNYSNVQRRAKAYPSIRQLSVLKGIGDQAVVASICPEVIDPSEDSLPHFGYRPAIAALTERLKERLYDPCLQRSLTPNEQGQVGCIILEGRRAVEGASCDCSSAGRRPVSEAYQGAEKAAREDVVSQMQGLDCFCEIEQLAGEKLAACQTEIGDEVETSAGDEVHGWCYVDATTVPPIGNPQLVAHCPVVEQRTIRFVGEGQAAMGATLFLTCQQSSD